MSLRMDSLWQSDEVAEGLIPPHLSKSIFYHLETTISWIWATMMLNPSHSRTQWGIAWNMVVYVPLDTDRISTLMTQEDVNASIHHLLSILHS